MTENPAENTDTAVYRAALDALPDPVLIYTDTHVVYANRAACSMLGGSEALLLRGMRVEDFILPDLAEVNNARRAYVIDQGVELRDLTVKIRGLDGVPVVFHVDIRPISFDGTTAAMATLAHR